MKHGYLVEVLYWNEYVEHNEDITFSGAEDTHYLYISAESFEEAVRIIEADYGEDLLDMKIFWKDCQYPKLSKEEFERLKKMPRSEY